MTRFREARKGFTLTEVLMAMFVMAIGMLSLLALFPVAFHNARWALDTEQVARGAANAQSNAELPRVRVDAATNLVNVQAHSLRNDDRYKPSLSNGNMCWRTAASMAPMLGRRDFLVDMSANLWTYETNIGFPSPPPNPGLPAGLPTARVKLPPVFVDPQVADVPAFIEGTTNLPFHIGVDNPAFAPFRSNGGIPQVINTVAALRPRWSIGIPRVSASHYNVNPLDLTKQTETTLGDEIDFGSNGQPLSNGTTYGRQRRFTWGYMCHWPEYTNTDICEVTAVIFNSRPNNSGLATLPPGEVTYSGNAGVSLASGIEQPGPNSNFGRVFVKGLNQATVFLGGSPTPMSLKVNDWILDSTLILPEYSDTVPQARVPFLDEYHPLAFYTIPVGPATIILRPGLVGGHFYKVLDISEVRSYTAFGPAVYYQTITLDRPARSDGFTATIMSGIADVITKGAGKMPQR